MQIIFLKVNIYYVELNANTTITARKTGVIRGQKKQKNVSIKTPLLHIEVKYFVSRASFFLPSVLSYKHRPNSRLLVCS